MTGDQGPSCTTRAPLRQSHPKRQYPLTIPARQSGGFLTQKQT